MKRKIEVLQLGNKIGFGKYTLNVLYKDMSADVLPISKKVYDALLNKYSLAEEG